MKLKMLAVYDKKTGTFDPPFTVRHHGEALREWEIVTKDPKTKFGKNPSDFDLYHLGEYDDASGVVENAQPHIQLAGGV